MSSFVSCLLTELRSLFPKKLKQIIFCSAQVWANLTPGTDKKKHADLRTGKVLSVLMLVILRGARYNDCETRADFSWIQWSGDHIWFGTSTICIKGQINVYFEGLVVWFIYRRFWSWRNLQQMNTAQKAVTRTLWKPLIKICSIWYVICPLKSQFKRDLATEFLKIALRNTSEGTSLW